LKRTTIAVTVLFLGLFSAATLLNDRPVAVFVGRSIQFALLVVLAPTCRHAARAYFRRFDWWRQPLLLIGEREDVELLADRLDRQWYLGLRPVLPGTTNEIPRRVVTTSHSMDAWEDIVWSFPHATFAPRPHLATAASHGDEGGLNTKNRLLIPSHQWLKRIMDLALILAGLPILLPLFLILIVAVKMSSPGPVFYRQARVGRDGRRFHAWKFRTMVHNADEILHDYLSRFPELQAEWKNDHKLKNDPRITPIGSLLRTTSLDELPQLWNVATGEMSLVGPRPIVSEEIVKYGNMFDLYQRVTPGITGLWQVSGRNDTSYAERLELDRYYVRNWSLWLDLFILFRTVRTVLLREGAY
jgi:Undecaprenyl-phosphate galactose phosphotransferase WbaP